MLALKILKISLIILISSFCLHLTGLTVADECWKSKGGGPTLSGNYTYTPDWHPAFQYDPNNPDEIDRNSSVEINVIGGFPPYTWQVSENGFSIPSLTTDRKNTLSADGTASGAATITVTDKRSASCTGYVRCTTGSWAGWGAHGLIWHDGAYTASGCDRPPGAYELIVGKWKYRAEDNSDYRCLCKGGGGYGSYSGPAGSDPEGNHSLNCTTTNCASEDCWRNFINIYEWQ